MPYVASDHTKKFDPEALRQTISKSPPTEDVFQTNATSQ